MTGDALLEALRASGLLDDGQLALAADRLAWGAAPAAVLGELLRLGALTGYQAKEIQQGRARGLSLGQYRILDEAGRGGFGRVFKGRHVLMGRVVAIKSLDEMRLEEAQARAWFKREVLAATQLVHPNIVMAYDAEEADGHLYFVMEYVNGPTLDRLVREHGPLPVGLGVEMLRQAALALQHAHDRGMVHRDIKPGNLLIPEKTVALLVDRSPMVQLHPEEHLVKITDFGLARVLNRSTVQSLTSESCAGFLGTPDYVAPEQAKNAHAADIRADIYSLGCTFYFALTGQKPFYGESPVEVILKHLHADAEPLEALRSDAPLALATIVRRMMEKSPEDRFQTPGELADALVDLQEHWDAVQGDLTAQAAALQAGTEVQGPASDGGALTGQTRLLPGAGIEEATTSPSPAGGRWSGEVARLPRKALTRKVLSIRIGPRPEIKPAAAGLAGETPTRVISLSGSALTSTPAAVPHPASDPADGGDGSRPEAPDEELTQPDAPMREAYARWLGVLDAVLLDRPISVDEAAYRSVHRALLAGCKRLADQHRGRFRVLFERLRSLVSPWLGLYVLEQADRATLASLRERCTRLEAPLALTSASDSGWMWALAILTGALTVFGVLYLFLTG